MGRGLDWNVSTNSFVGWIIYDESNYLSALVRKREQGDTPASLMGDFTLTDAARYWHIRT